MFTVLDEGNEKYTKQIKTKMETRWRCLRLVQILPTLPPQSLSHLIFFPFPTRLSFLCFFYTRFVAGVSQKVSSRKNQDLKNMSEKKKIMYWKTSVILFFFPLLLKSNRNSSKKKKKKKKKEKNTLTVYFILLQFFSILVFSP